MTQEVTELLKKALALPPEARAALELKSFSMGPQRALAIRVSGWKMEADRAREIEKQMTEAVARLAAALQNEST